MNKSLLSMGHARAILALPEHDQPEIGRLVVNRGLSVLETEALVKKTLSPASKKPVKVVADEVPERTKMEHRSMTN